MGPGAVGLFRRALDSDGGGRLFGQFASSLSGVISTRSTMVESMNKPIPFHLAIPVHSLEAARRFYGEILDLREGRSAERWVDYDFFGHQLVVHLTGEKSRLAGRNDVDSDAVPVPHFGAVLPWGRFWRLAEALQTAEVDFVIPPRIRFEGLPGEQATFFLYDPSGNALEFKAFRDLSKLFATEFDE